MSKSSNWSNASEVGYPSNNQMPILCSLSNKDEGFEETYHLQGAPSGPASGEKYVSLEAESVGSDLQPPQAHGNGHLHNATEEIADFSRDSKKETPLLKAAEMIANAEQEVSLSEVAGKENMEDSLGCHQEACLSENFAARNDVNGNGAMEILPMSSANCGEKRVGSVLAAAMRKYSVPKSSCYHGVTR